MFLDLKAEKNSLPMQKNINTQSLVQLLNFQRREIFSTLFIFVHGYASMFANNSMEYDEKELIGMLNKFFCGAVYAAKEVTDEEDI